MILSTLIILAIIDSGLTGDEESEKIDKEVYQSRRISPLVNQTLLDIYHATDPLRKGHEGRINKTLRGTGLSNLRRRALYCIEKMSEEWPRLTGLKREETNEILDKIYSGTKTGGPDQERRIRDKLLEVRPDLRRIHPEYIRSVIHNWYRSRQRAMLEAGQIRSREDQADLLYTFNQVTFGEGYIHDRLAKKWKQFHPELSNFSNNYLKQMAYKLLHANPPYSSEEMEKAEERYKRIFGSEPVKHTKRLPSREATSYTGKIRSREDRADLLYTYNQVKSGKGYIHDRLAEKWKQFHPYSSNYSKISLFKKANNLSNADSGVRPEVIEMEAAKIRYEKVFGSGDAAPQERVKWTEDRTADLLFLTHKFKRRGSGREAFIHFWRALHPELASIKKSTIDERLKILKKKNYKLTLEEETAAEARFRTALERNKLSHQNVSITDKGKSAAAQDSPGQELHQPTSDWVIHSPPHHDDLQLTQEEQNDLEMWMNQGTFHHQSTPRYLHTSYYYRDNSPPALSQFPAETSHSYSTQTIYDPHTANPYYEHGSSSHPPDNPHP